MFAILAWILVTGPQINRTFSYRTPLKVAKINFQLLLTPSVILFLFFFFRDLRSRSDGANSPIRIRHSERAAYFLFVVARSAFGFPAPLPPRRGGITPRRGVITRRLMRTRV